MTKLLKSIRWISNQIDTNTSVYDAFDEAKKLYYIYIQSDDETKTKKLNTMVAIFLPIKYYWIMKRSPIPSSAITQRQTMNEKRLSEIRWWLLGFAEVRKVYRITIDTDIAATMNVHLHNGNIMTFTEVDLSLYIFQDNTQQDIFTSLTLISENRFNYSKRELQGADMARDLHLKIRYPGYQKFFKFLETNFFRNCPLTSNDTKRSLHINGPDTLKGKMTRPSASKIENLQQIRIPRTITDTHPTVEISANFFLFSV